MNLSTGTRSTPSLLSGNWLRFYEAHLTALSWPGILVPCLLSSFTFGVVQVRASQGRRGRDTGSYVDRGERREVRARAARNVKRLRRRGTSSVKALWVLPAALVLVACTANEPGTGQRPQASSPTTAVSATAQSPSATRAQPKATSTPKPTKPPHPISVQALINKDYDGRDLKVGRLLADYGAYKRYIITYRGDGLTISGVMNVPDGKGPFPVLVRIQDDTCPIRWSEATVRALKAEGKDVTFVKYRGEGHTFERQWQRSIERTVSFFDKNLD